MEKYTYNNKTGLSIALTNLNAYNNGSLIYEWLDLPFNDEELKNTLDKIGINSNNEEYFISDFDNYLDLNIKLSEYENIHQLNELLTLLDELNKYDYIKLQAYCEYEGGLDVKQIIQLLEDEELDNIIFFEDIKNERDLGELLVFEEFQNSPLEYYYQFLDLEAIGFARSVNTGGGFTSYGYIEC